MTGPAHHQTFRFPSQQVVLLPGGHYAFFENPHEFGQALAAFSHKRGR